MPAVDYHDDGPAHHDDDGSTHDDDGQADNDHDHNQADDNDRSTDIDLDIAAVVNDRAYHDPAKHYHAGCDIDEYCTDVHCLADHDVIDQHVDDEHDEHDEHHQHDDSA